MSREILFKAKRIDNGEWVEGYYINTIVGKTNIPCIIPHENLFKVLDNNMYQVESQTICQYTGLTDKNGKRIWENDIVKLEDYHGHRIVYVFYGNCGSWFYGGDGFSDEYIWNGQDKEVIGNIFDNPELLEQEEAKNER